MKDRRSSSGGLVVFAAISLGVCCLLAQGAPSRPAVPVKPIAAILDAFRSHSLVTMSSHHGNEQINAFEISLIRDPRFAAAVNDIVVEFGSAKYQDLIDRFVAGNDVPPASLRHVWQDTTVAFATWDSPLTEDFFRAVRAANATLPRRRQIRVWLGEPPIDWDTIHRKDDYNPWLQRRESYPGELIQREVLAKHRRALVVYGQMHAQRKDLLTNFERGDGLFGLEGAGKTHVFSIWTADSADLAKIQGDVANWPIPSLALFHGTALGAADFTAYYPYETPRFDIEKGNGVQVPRDQWRSMRMEDQFDAVLYLGPQSALTNARLSPALCADAGYVEMRVQRMTLTGTPQTEAERFKQNCAVIASKQ